MELVTLLSATANALSISDIMEDVTFLSLLQAERVEQLLDASEDGLFGNSEKLDSRVLLR